MRAHRILMAMAVAFGTTTAANAACEQSKAVGTGVGAVGGGLIGDAVTHGSAVGVIGGAVVGGLAGHGIAGSNCRHYYRHRTGYYDRYHHWHSYASDRT